MSVQAASIVTVDVSEDTYIRPAGNSAKNYDTNGYVEIRDINSNSGSRIAFMKFTVPDLGAVTIDSAKLKLKIRKVNNEVAPASVIDVKLLNGVNANNWNEGTLTWDNAPDLTDTTSIDNKEISSIGGVNDDTWVEFDVSTAITQPGTYTLLLTTDAATTTIVQFYSKTNLNDSADLELTVSAQSLVTGLDVTPSHVHVVAPLVGASNKLVQQVTLVNNEAVSVSNINVVNVSTPGFIISNDNCTTPGTLAAGESCTFNVEAGNGVDDSTLSPDFGFINITSDSSVTPSFPIFVSQTESDQQQAIRRVPAVVTDITVIDDLTSVAPVGTLLPGQSYTVNFSMQGYDDGYETFAALFACATPDDSCAEKPSDILVWDRESVESSLSTSDFLYTTATSQSYQYSINLTMPTYAEGGYSSTDAIVLRFYQRAQLDISQGNSSTSVIVPGGQSLNMIGKLGRKIIIWQQP